MIHLVVLLAGFVLIGLTLMFGVMVLVGGLRFDDSATCFCTTRTGRSRSRAIGSRVIRPAPSHGSRSGFSPIQFDMRLALVPDLRRQPRRVPAFDRLLVADVELLNSATFRAR